MFHNDVLFSVLTQTEPRFVRVIGRDSRPEGTNSGLKRRDCAVIHYVLSGAGYFDGNRVTAGQGFYFPSRELHRYHADPENPWDYVFMDFSQKFADWFVAPVIDTDERGIFSYSFSEQLLRWAEQKLANAADREMISQTEALYLATSVLNRHTPSRSFSVSNQEIYVQKARMYIDGNLSRKLTVSEIAGAVCLNERYLCSLFVQQTGMSVKEYLTAQRLSVAKELLVDTELPVKEIARHAGFADANCFSKSFRQKLGCSPGQYRSTHTKA